MINSLSGSFNYHLLQLDGHDNLLLHNLPTSASDPASNGLAILDLRKKEVAQRVPRGGEGTRKFSTF